MGVLETILIVLEALCSVALIVVVLMQSGKEAGLSAAISGASESYLSKNKKSGLDHTLAVSTKWIAIVWVLMAGDILLYQSDLVPVGADQKQHIEIARDIAIRFNNAYGETFKVPEGFIPKFGARVMSLQDPSMKMSKSDPNPNGFVAIMDDPSVIMKKFKRAVTDSDTFIAFDPENKPGVSNLLSIYTSFTGLTMDEAVKHFDGLGYGSLKTEVAEAVIAGLEPVQNEYKKILSDKAYLEKIMADGAEKASAQARKTLRKVYRKVGLA